MASQNQLTFVNKAPEGVNEAYQSNNMPVTPHFEKNQFLTPHWHPNANEITTCTKGSGQVVLISPNPSSPHQQGTAIKNVYDMTVNQSVFIPKGYFHYFINTGTENFDLELTFSNPDFDILTLDNVVNLLPEYIRKPSLNGNPTIEILTVENKTETV